MTRWIPDTCDCVIEYANNLAVEKIIKKCRLHSKIKRDYDLFQTVLAQNRKFNVSQGETPNESQVKIMELAKAINKKRIRVENLKDFVEDVPELMIIEKGLVNKIKGIFK